MQNSVYKHNHMADAITAKSYIGNIRTSHHPLAQDATNCTHTAVFLHFSRQMEADISREAGTKRPGAGRGHILCSSPFTLNKIATESKEVQGNKQLNLGR